jgi:hypothetical protein
LDKQRRVFFWQGDRGSTKKKYRLLKWGCICKSKKNGGLGIMDIRKMNIILLCKWWWKLENEDGLWQQVVKAKYIRGGLVSTVRHKLTDSPVWTDLLKVKRLYLKGMKIETKNGKNTLFWKDPWLDDKPICTITPVVFDLCEDKDVTVYQFLVCGGQLKFTRWLPPILFEQWVEIVENAFNFQFCNTDDTVKWRRGGGGGFTQLDPCMIN